MPRNQSLFNLRIGSTDLYAVYSVQAQCYDQAVDEVCELFVLEFFNRSEWEHNLDRLDHLVFIENDEGEELDYLLRSEVFECADVLQVATTPPTVIQAYLRCIEAERTLLYTVIWKLMEKEHNAENPLQPILEPRNGFPEE